ncbi:MAG: RNA-binding S4 domain-containing protein [Cytophagales bacterium]|nr:RNA-binding S4 domain-containing protein [Armatimonadota bacterium]
MQDIPITSEHLTLGQFLKLAGLIGSGGEVKTYLMETSIQVNGEHDNRRGRKLFPGDILVVEKGDPFRIVGMDPQDL